MEVPQPSCNGCPQHPTISVARGYLVYMLTWAIPMTPYRSLFQHHARYPELAQLLRGHYNNAHDAARNEAVVCIA